MASVYTPHGASGFRRPLDPARCKASVGGGRDPRPHQCERKPKVDGWCRQHHPDTVAARRKVSSDRWDRENLQRRRSLLYEQIGGLIVASSEEPPSHVADLVEEARKLR